MDFGLLVVGGLPVLILFWYPFLYSSLAVSLSFELGTDFLGFGMFGVFLFTDFLGIIVLLYSITVSGLLAFLAAQRCLFVLPILILTSSGIGT